MGRAGWMWLVCGTVSACAGPTPKTPWTYSGMPPLVRGGRGGPLATTPSARPTPDTALDSEPGDTPEHVVAARYAGPQEHSITATPATFANATAARAPGANTATASAAGAGATLANSTAASAAGTGAPAANTTAASVTTTSVPTADATATTPASTSAAAQVTQPNLPPLHWARGRMPHVDVATAAHFITLQWPVPATGITSLFGPRKDPIDGKDGFHYGVDLAAEYGTVIEAAADGVVLWAGWNGGHGRRIILQHAGGFRTSYSHLSQLIVDVGMHVVRGQAIGLVGNSGRSTGPHLHFEVTRNGAYLDPLDVLGVPQKIP